MKNTVLALIALITLNLSTHKSVANTQTTILPLASTSQALTEKEANELAKLKELAKEEGLSIPSQTASRFLELSLKTVLFTNIDHTHFIAYANAGMQTSYDHHLQQAMADWDAAYANQKDSHFIDFKLTGISKSGFKVRFSNETENTVIEQSLLAIHEKHSQRGGVCGVSRKENELKLICLNLSFRRTGEVSADEVKKITSSIRGHDTQAGGLVCTASGCGTYKSGTVKQLDAASTRTVKTGKKVKQTQVRTYTDRAEVEMIDQIQI